MSARPSSLRIQLMMLIVVAIFGAVALATFSFVWREIESYRAERARELETNAVIFAATISGEVRKGDRAATLASLRAIADLPRLERVRVDLPDGTRFAELGSSIALDSDKKPGWLGNRVISQSVQIVDRGETIGELTITADISDLGRNIQEVLKDAISAAFFSAALGLLIALRMQRRITSPIINLSQVMRGVREKNDFGMRAERISMDETGELVDAFNHMLDSIQERDARLLAQQQNLQKIVTQRTAELKLAKEAAESANSAKSDFLATMSHEIRTPMNGLLVMAELMSHSDMPPRQKRYADVIVRSGQSLLSIINDILDFSKIEAGKLELEKIAVKPADVINDVITLFWERAQSKRVDLAAYTGPGVPDEIEGDPVRITQVISNLLSNALKFTENGTVVVAARRIACDRGECFIEFSVTDSGVGISDEKQAKIFEAFSQADQSTTRKYGGTGLGLAICRRLVEAMGGTIGVASKQGRGARFYFNLPARELVKARMLKRIGEKKNAVIAIPGTATPIMLARYLDEVGVTAQIISSDAAVEDQIAYVDYIFASPEYLKALHQILSGDPTTWIPARICISELGDAGPDELLREGVAEDLLVRPFSRRDVFDQMERMFDGRLRGASALNDVKAKESKTLLFSGARVLAADDSPVNREVVREALTRLGASVTLVEDGAQALKAVERQEFDAILMDCSMPVMDGFKATQAIRAHKDSRVARTPIIALTAHVEGGNERWREVGMDDYVTKPFTLSVISGVFGKFIKPTGVGMLEKAPLEAPAAPMVEEDAPARFDERVFADLRAMQSGDVDLVGRALDLFEKHSRDAMLRLAHAARGRNAKDIASAAHALKSMAFNVGARSFGLACAAVEKAADDLPALPALLKRVRHEYSATLGELPAVRRRNARRAA